MDCSCADGLTCEGGGGECGDGKDRTYSYVKSDFPAIPPKSAREPHYDATSRPTNPSCSIAGFNQEWGRQSRRYTESAFIQSANSRIDSQRSRYHFPSFASENNSNNDAQLQSFDYELKRRTKDQWIGGKEMKQIIAAEEQQMAIQQQAKQRREMMIARDESRKIKPIDFKSIISYTDANTLEIEFPATGITSSSVAAGVFAAVWFGAITPATLSMLSAGVAPLLFITPFWIAGAAVAKVNLDLSCLL
jgi:hypothetical protein